MADFIGTTNLLRGHGRMPTAASRLDSGERRCRAPHDGGLPGGRDVEISIRPESIEPRAGATPRAPSGAQVEQAAYLGNTVSVPRPHGAAGCAITVLAPKAGIRLPVGSDVAVTWPAADALVLGRARPDARRRPR